MGQLKHCWAFGILNSKMTLMTPFLRAQNVTHSNPQTNCLNSRAGKGLMKPFSQKNIYMYIQV